MKIEELLTLADAGKSLGVHPDTLRNQIHKKKLTGFKLGRNWFVTTEEVERYRKESRNPIMNQPARKEA